MSVIQSNASCFYDKVIHEKFSRLLTINYSEISNLTNFFGNIGIIIVWDHSFSTYVKVLEISYPLIHRSFSISGGKDGQFFGRFCVQTKWLISMTRSKPPSAKWHLIF